jgi:hypothetical protein
VSGRRIHGGDDRTRPAVWLIRQDDGSWLIAGVGEHPIRLPREVMLIIAENVLRHRESSTRAWVTVRLASQP